MKSLGAFFGVATLCVSAVGFAQVESGQYNELIAIASKHAAEKQLRQIPGARLGSRAQNALKLNGRFYEPGQSWLVKFLPTSDPAVAGMSRKSAPLAEPTLTPQPTTYEFKVLEVTPEHQANIQIKQRILPGDASGDGRVERIVLTMSAQFTPVRKSVFYRDGRRPISIDFEGHGALAMGFEATPVDLPNLNSDDGHPVSDANGRGALEFRVSDLFGRPVEALWREGELWPAVVKSVAGTAVVQK